MSPFDLDNDSAYQVWRQQKLAEYPTTLEQLVVEITDPRSLTADEHHQLARIIAKTNMAIYASPLGDTPDKEIVKQVGLQFGLKNLDNNLCADDDAISSLQATSGEIRKGYIPYTNRPIAWHTDGYYNTAENQIRGMLLHCVRPASDGGLNQLLDHEIIYIQLRDESPDYIQALMRIDAMTIPANIENGAELRPEVAGPVFSIMPEGGLHMRYTHRKRSIRWRDDPVTRAAVSFLGTLLTPDNPYCFEGKLQSGQGLISTNVLHTRTGFGGNSRRLLYRARYFDPIRL